MSDLLERVSNTLAEQRVLIVWENVVYVYRYEFIDLRLFKSAR